MWKTVFFTLILMIASVLLIAEATLATPWLEGNSWLAENAVNTVSPDLTRSPETPPVEVEASPSDRQTTDKTTENQNPAPETQPALKATPTAAAKLYDMEAIEKYNQENYGAGN